MALLNLLNLFFCFQFVSPLRYAHIYSEKIVHLPHCYFVNDYKQVSTLKCYLVFWASLFISFACALPIICCAMQKNLDALDPNCQHKRSDYGLPEGKFIFACFNQLYKMDPEIFNTW